MQFLLTPGCHSFPARLPEQHSVRLETAELHRGRPWGTRTLAGIRPPGFLRPVTDDLNVMIAPVGMRDVAWLQQHIAGLTCCLSAINTQLIWDWQACGLGSEKSMKMPTLTFSLRFSRTAVKSSLRPWETALYSTHDIIITFKGQFCCVVSHTIYSYDSCFYSELTLKITKGKKNC